MGAMTTTTKSEPKRRRQMSLYRMIRTRPRLFISGSLAIVFTIGLFLFTDWKVATRLLVGWDAGVALYLVLVFMLMKRSDVHRIRHRARLQDDGRIAILVLTAGAAVASLGAIVAELGTQQGSTRTPSQLVIGTVTILLSWAFIHAMFALHYAHEFYDDDDSASGLAFPGKEEPDYWDFLYFSLVIGMTSQVSDVAVTSKSIRNTVAAHGVVSFFFNVALLALMVNIAASAI
jgi:uncharacterized membrane protein